MATIFLTELLTKRDIAKERDRMGDVVHLDIGGQTHSIAIKEYRGQRVVTFRDIDELHKRPEGTARRNFNKNQHRFIEGEDYFIVDQPYEIRTLGLTRPQGGVPDKVILITESGYLMLVKSFNDDLAWQVQRALVNHYFRAKQLMMPATIEDLIIMQAQSVKELKAKVAAIEDKVNAAHHRIDNLDKLDIIGDPQQRLNAMVKKYAVQNGLSFRRAWHEFRQAFNTAYHTNLSLLMSHYKFKHGLKELTIPQYLAAVGRLDDGIRVADKLLNKDMAAGGESE